VRTDEDLVKET